MNTLTRYNRFGILDPFREFEKTENRLAQLLRRSTSDIDAETASFSQWTPSVDIIEDEKEFLVKAELPEIKKEDVKVSVENGMLQISGERNLEKEEKGKKYHRIEREYGSFARSFTLPDGADSSKITADFKDGVLQIHIGKNKTSKPGSVDIKVS